LNRHLNIFRPFNQNPSKENIEDNLSRALVICLRNDSLLLFEFLKQIFVACNQEKDFKNLYADVTELDKWSMDIQVETLNFQDQFTKVYAVAMSGLKIDFSNFFNTKTNPNKKHITDIFITIRDIAICIEVKRDNTNCVSQLFQQAASLFSKHDKIEDVIFPVDFNWKKLMSLINSINGFHKLKGFPSIYLSDFIELVQAHNPNWIPIAPLSSIENRSGNEFKIYQRINAALKLLEDDDIQILSYNDRIGIQFEEGWAKEVVLYLSKRENNELNLILGIWPGNTKGQGTKLLKVLKNNKDWSPPESLVIDSNKFDVDSGYEFKFCHFNGYVTNVIVGNSKIKPGIKLISDHIHWNHTGKYDRNQWQNLEDFLDNTFTDNYDWRRHSDWKRHFIDSNRNYLTLSIGYQIETTVPISYLKKIDTDMNNLKPLKGFIKKVFEKYKHLFDGK
jgi:hypothetical protein